MIILGVDPGTAETGYGVIEESGHVLRVLAFGTIKTSPRHSAPVRLAQTYDRLSEIIRVHKPDVMAVERLFFARNEKTALSVGRTIGVLLLCAAQKSLDTIEYTPNEVKQAVVGYGAADKRQVQCMVARLLRLEEVPKPDHAADALALCICHAHSAKIRHLSKENEVAVGG